MLHNLRIRMVQENKHILIVSHYYPPHVGGIEMVAHNQAKRLVALGHTVTVVTSRIGQEETRSVIDGVIIISVGASNIFERWGVPFPIFYPSLFYTLLKVAKKADIVHIHDAFYISSYAATIAAWFYRKPIVLTQHVAMIAHTSKVVLAIEKIVYATTGNFVFKTSDLILTYNDRVKLFLLSRGIPLEKIAILKNGVDTDLFHSVSAGQKIALRRELGLSHDKKIILFVGRFVHKKGFDAVLEARSGAYQTVFVGGERPGAVDGDVVFLGKLSAKELVPVYQSVDIFVLPSQGEGFPLSIQEAMASGLPIITSDDPGYDLYRFDRNSICLIKDPNGASVRRAIESILNNKEQLEKMATYSKKYAQDNFDWSKVVSELNAAYDLILKKKGNKYTKNW